MQVETAALLEDRDLANQQLSEEVVALKAQVEENQV
jgi:hypothetical protein